MLNSWEMWEVSDAIYVVMFKVNFVLNAVLKNKVCIHIQVFIFPPPPFSNC